MRFPGDVLHAGCPYRFVSVLTVGSVVNLNRTGNINTEDTEDAERNPLTRSLQPVWGH